VPEEPTNHAPLRTPWWLWINVLSLDAPLVAVIWQAALARVHRVVLQPGCYIALGLAVWVIYMADRVIDSFGKTEGCLLTARHVFYRRHRTLYVTLILPAAVLLLLKNALWDIPSGLMWRGLGLGFAVSLYLLHYSARHHRPLYITGNLATCLAGILLISIFPVPLPLRILFCAILGGILLLSIGRSKGRSVRLVPKELVCGFFFATGCSLAVGFYTADEQVSPLRNPETLMLALLCALNCVAIACYERTHDAINDPHAITRTWPKIARFYPAMLLALIFIAVAALVGGLPREASRYTWCVLVSAILLGILHSLSKRLQPELSHVLADAALVTPLVMLAMR
jgi:hypothetical protein